MTSWSLGGQRDDERAFLVLLERHRAGLEVFCVLMLGDLQQAEHAMREAVLTAWRGRALARASPSTRIWLYRIAVRVCSDALESNGDEFARGRSLDGLNGDENISGQL
jgi:RNA polymerase sigma-70 factor (ECF subfamily)